MAKKNFDSFLSTVGKTPRLSPLEIEEMAQEIHGKKHEPEPEPQAPKPVPAKKTIAQPAEKKPKAIAIQPPQSAEPGKRGRKPNPPEEERLIRVSVDLPESVIIDLKGRVVRERVPMKDFIRRLVERELGR